MTPPLRAPLNLADSDHFSKRQQSMRFYWQARVSRKSLRVPSSLECSQRRASVTLMVIGPQSRPEKDNGVPCSTDDQPRHFCRWGVWPSRAIAIDAPHERRSSHAAGASKPSTWSSQSEIGGRLQPGLTHLAAGGGNRLDLTPFH